MLDEDGFNDYCRRLVFLPQTVELIQRIRSSDPSRRVSGGGRSVCARYPSRKMGLTIQAESDSCELVFILQCEHDPEVLEYYDQPEMIRLNCKTADGRPNPRYHTPDFFILATTWAGWVECKTEEELTRRESKGDSRFCRHDDGAWISPPGQEYAARFGLQYRVWTPAETNLILQRNIQFLEPYLRDGLPDLSNAAREEVLLAIKSQEGIKLSELVQSLQVATSDTVNAMIASEEIYADLAQDSLTEQEYVRVFSSAVVAQAWATTKRCAGTPTSSPFIRTCPRVGALVLWNGVPYTVANVGPDVITLINNQKNLVPMLLEAYEQLLLRGELTIAGSNEQAASNDDALNSLRSAGPDELGRALRRHDALNGAGDSGCGVQAKPERSVRRWKAMYRRAQQLHGNGFLGLISHSQSQGNRNRKLPEDTLAATQLYVEKVYERPKQQSRFSAYAMLLTYCDSHNVVPPSYKTFCTAVKNRGGPNQTMKRRGARAAYQEELFQNKPPGTSSRHGDRPFEVVHLDHTRADIQLIHSGTRENLGRPWVTKLTDAFSRRILAVYCTYDPPSICSCMMVLTECVRRHRRLPETIVTDRGHEFGSTCYETLLAAYGITQKSRPPAKPRHGSVDERLFRTMNSQFIHNLKGNTQIMRAVRQVTKAVDPKRLATWTLRDFHEKLSEWCYSVYDQMDHPELGMSPREAFRRGLEKYGDRPQNLVPFDDRFYFLSLPNTRSGVAKIDRQRGVKIQYLYYYCSAFGRPENAGRSVPVRYDPFNRGVAYAFVDGHWERCISQEYSAFRNRSDREVSTAVRELRAKHREHGRRYVTVTARALGRFLTSLEANETLVPIRLRDNEARSIVGSVLGKPTDDNSRDLDDGASDPGRTKASGDSIGGLEWVVRDDDSTGLDPEDLDPLEDYR